MRADYAWKHTLLALAPFSLLLVCASRVNSLFGGFVVFVALGIAQYRLYFPLHGCAHHSLFLRQAQNRFFGSLFGALLFTPFSRFRDEHLLHHRAYGTAADPGSVDYLVKLRSREALAKFLAAPLFGAAIARKVRNAYVGEKTPALDVIPVVLVQGALLLWLQPARYLFFVFLPAATVFLFLSRLRMFLEHVDLDAFGPGKTARVIARTIRPTDFEKLVLTGMEFHRHQEHHDFPQEPSSSIKGEQPSAPSYTDILLEAWRALEPRTEGIDYFNPRHPLMRLQTRASLKVRGRMLEALSLRSGMRVLEVGATPDDTLADSNFFARKAKELGCEVWICSPEDCTQIAAKYGFQILPFKALGGNDLPRFDAVISSAVLEHVGTNKLAHLQTLSRFQAPLTVITTPNRYHWLEFHTKLPLLHWLPKPLHRLLLRSFGKRLWADPAHLDLISRKELARHCAHAFPDRLLEHRRFRFLFAVSNLMVVAREIS